MHNPHIVIAGAGSIGCFVGGLLSRAGRNVTFLGRASMAETVGQNGLSLTDFAELSETVEPQHINFATDPACLALADLVIVTVKSGATEEMAGLIAEAAPRSAPVVSLQNGVSNADNLAAQLPGRDVRAGMVPFNVVPMGHGRFHRSTSGDIRIGSGPRDLASVLSGPHLAVAETPDIKALLWGKLLINLNNALNALSGLPLQTQLLNRDWRRVMADQMAEALIILQAAGIAVGSTTPVPSRFIPHILRLPTPLFRALAARMLTIDPTARASMSYDLEAGRRTEIDVLQGKIIDLARDHGRRAPLCTRVRELIRAAEDARSGSPCLSPAQVSRAD